MTPSLVPLPVAVPLGSAALLLMFGALLGPRVVAALTIVASLAETVLAAVLTHEAGSGLIVYWFGGWTPRHGVAIGVSFTVDRFGAGAATFAGVIVTAAVLSVPASFKDRVVVTHALMLTMLGAMAGFCLTGDLFNMFVFYELMAVSAFALAAYSVGRTASLRAALNFAISNSVGAFLLLIGIGLLYGRTGALNLAEIGHRLGTAHRTDGLVTMAVTAITVGLLVKAAIVPFHFWLIDVASWGSLPLVVVLGGVLDTLAVYGVARVYWTAFAPVLDAHDGSLRTLLVTMGVATAVGGAALCFVVRGARRVVACVMISHTGTLLVGIGCLTAFGIAGAVIYAVAGGALKAAIVACVGDLDADESPAGPLLAIALLTVCGLALAGLPLFGTALGESVIERSLAAAGEGWIAPVLVIASALTGAAVLRIAFAAARHGPTRAPATRVTIVAATLVAVAVGARFALARIVARSAGGFVASAAYSRAVLDGHRFVSLPAIAGVRLPAGGTVLDLVAVAGGIGVVVWLDWLRPRYVTVLGGTIVGNAVRRLHSGGLGDSVAWVTLGATVVALALAATMR